MYQYLRSIRRKSNATTNVYVGIRYKKEHKNIYEVKSVLATLKRYMENEMGKVFVRQNDLNDHKNDSLNRYFTEHDAPEKTVTN